MTATADRNLQIVGAYLDEHSPQHISQEAYLRDWSQPDPIEGVDAIAGMLYEMYHVAFPGAEAAVRSISAGAAAVTLEFTFKGTNDGPFMGRPPTGRAVEVPMCAVYAMADDAIGSIHVYYDSATMERQLTG